MFIRKTIRLSGLPEEVQKLIRRVVRKTRLRRHERVDVTHELISHFEDAINEGVEPKTVIADYGNVKTTAKLLRKAKKRQRWWVERLFVRSCKLSVITIVFFAFIYASLFGLTLLRKPTIKVDYIARLNDAVEPISEEDRAWPYYRAASLAERNDPFPREIFENDRSTGAKALEWPTWPDQENWSYFDEWLQLHHDTLALIHEGAAKKGLGLIASTMVTDEDAVLWQVSYDNLQSDPPEPWILNVFQAHAGDILSLAHMLALDTRTEAYAGNSAQCMTNIDAMLRMARQVREIPSAFSEHAPLTLCKLFLFSSIRDILEREPYLFSDIQFVALKEKLLALDEVFDVQFDGYQLFMLDLVQRTYTDDGHCDGVFITDALLPILPLMYGEYYDVESVAFESKILSPLGDVVMASRKELLTEFDRQLAEVQRKKLSRLAVWHPTIVPTWQSELTPSEIQDSPRVALNLFRRYYLIDVVMPLINELGFSAAKTKGERDGLLAAIYAIEYHREVGFWPKDLQDAGVIDSWSGFPLKIIQIDGAPIIYSVGDDQDDDRGKSPLYGIPRWKELKKVRDGDWVYWTLAKNDE